MREEKVLILDSDVDSREILKEHINSFGYFKVYLSTNPETLADETMTKSFHYIFIDAETVTLKEGAPALGPMSFKPDTAIVVMHREYDSWAREIMDTYQTKVFLKKPFNIKRLSEVLSITPTPNNV